MGKPDFVLVGEGKQRGPSPTQGNDAAPEPALHGHGKRSAQDRRSAGDRDCYRLAETHEGFGERSE